MTTKSNGKLIADAAQSLADAHREFLTRPRLQEYERLVEKARFYRGLVLGIRSGLDDAGAQKGGIRNYQECVDILR
jgi:hypothetical protein